MNESAPPGRKEMAACFDLASPGGWAGTRATLIANRHEITYAFDAATNERSRHTTSVVDCWHAFGPWVRGTVDLDAVLE